MDSARENIMISVITTSIHTVKLSMIKNLLPLRPCFIFVFLNFKFMFYNYQACFIGKYLQETTSGNRVITSFPAFS